MGADKSAPILAGTRVSKTARQERVIWWDAVGARSVAYRHGARFSCKVLGFDIGCEATDHLDILKDGGKFWWLTQSGAW